MKTKLIILAIWVGLVAWYGYSIYSVQKENAELRIKQLQAVDLE